MSDKSIKVFIKKGRDMHKKVAILDGKPKTS